MITDQTYYHITFHQQLDCLRYHIDNVMSWKDSGRLNFVLTSAHLDNLEKIKQYITNKYPEKKVETVKIPVDKGYNLGTITNVVEGLRYIAGKGNFDYVINVEADNMFYFENKVNKILDLMKLENKHVLIIPEGDVTITNIGNDIFGRRGLKIGCHLSNNIPKYYHFTTLNMFSKEYLTNFFPFEYYDDIINFSWAGRPNTPYEDYMGLATMKKNALTEESQVDFYRKVGLKLDYNIDHSPFGWNEPDNMVPDKFIKWGIINAPSTAGGSQHGDWTNLIGFINKHKPLVVND
ncbi:MAG: hypothetical protein EBU90_03395 [Proteobacteria bacterium]|nr:hypothetical protein [Pseudomonadota bacterium]NBP13372.1 hypothetical protein [bacterium]